MHQQRVHLNSFIQLVHKIFSWSFFFWLLGYESSHNVTLCRFESKWEHSILSHSSHSRDKMKAPICLTLYILLDLRRKASSKYVKGISADFSCTSFLTVWWAVTSKTHNNYIIKGFLQIRALKWSYFKKKLFCFCCSGFYHGSPPTCNKLTLVIDVYFQNLPSFQ